MSKKMALRSEQERMFAKTLGAWIYESRRALKLSLDALGTELGVHRNTIWRYERGAAIPNAYQVELVKHLVKRAAIGLVRKPVKK